MSKGTTPEVQCAKCIVQGAKWTLQIPWGWLSRSSLDVVIPLIESSSSSTSDTNLNSLEVGARLGRSPRSKKPHLHYALCTPIADPSVP